MKTVRVILLALCLTWLASFSRAAEPVLPLRTNDVIAFIGGANMVDLAQNGHLETLLTLRHPHHKLRFRSLAWEGDTVFAQPRDVNYPDLVTQLKQVGATVAFVQFGQMESLAGEAGRTAFIQAYDELLFRLTKTVPRLVLMIPSQLDRPDPHASGKAGGQSGPAGKYSESMRWLAGKHGALVVDLAGEPGAVNGDAGALTGEVAARVAARCLHQLRADALLVSPLQVEELRRAVVEKSRLWFDYARPSNWAFLAGDRTEQAFSRDYRDRNIRAFAQEMQQFVPLIADAEKRIDELAAKAAADKDTTR